jgi:GNAT superfamily N-acetyltransferase
MTFQEPPERSARSTPTLRRATAGDLDEVVRIWEEGWADAHTGHVPDGLLPFRQHAHFAALAAERVPTTWVGVVDGVVAGFVVVKHDEIEQIYVDRRQRGTGIATLLLQAGEREIHMAGHPRAWLAVVAGNARARAFYARLGWRDGGPMTYQAQTTAGTFAVPTHRYERDLNASA